MELSDSEIQIQNEAVEYIKSKKGELIDRFIIQKNPLRRSLFAFFMAGSPGAGKTEFTKRYFPIFFSKKNEALVKAFEKAGIDVMVADKITIRIDVDEIRDFLPQYRKTNTKNGQKGNAHIIQKAANKGLDYLRDYCLGNDISFIHDGTFGNYGTMETIIKKTILKNRIVCVYYIYLDPLIAWDFTKAREALEGRNIKKEKFIEQFFNAQENVCKIKKNFGEKVFVHFILKDNKNEMAKIEFNQSDIAKCLENYYTKGTIKRYSPEDLSNLLR